MKRIGNLAKLWLPLGRRCILSGVKIRGEIVKAEPAKSIALGKAWQTVFNEKSFCEERANTLLNDLGDIGGYEGTRPPNFWDFQHVISHPPSTAPGPDTLPYSAWTSASHNGVFTLLGVDACLRNGTLPPIF